MIFFSKIYSVSEVSKCQSLRTHFSEVSKCLSLKTFLRSVKILVCQDNFPLARQKHCHLLNFLSASIFKVLQYCSKLEKILSECQAAWILVRSLIRIQAVGISDYSSGWRSKANIENDVIIYNI